ncbi:MAG: hypothetical protein Q9191_000071 [Dirinaria sp. TL-2023a]
MLRPATPLSIVLSVAFVLLLLSTISTPIVRGIPLATFDGIDFGVFGHCKGDSCSGIQIGYKTDSQTLFGNDNENNDFSLPAGARSSLSSILIVHPIAALLTLICLILAATAHLHSPSHSPRYLMALLLLLIPTLLITLLAFLVDILLFVPHLKWGGWIVLVSTILITIAGVVTCAMRRTLVSRKARKKRIAENAEMNGQNFYARQAGARAESPPPLDQTAAPMANGAPMADKLPTFATFEKAPQGTDEERIPLKSRSPSNRTAPSSATRTVPSEEGINRYGGPERGGNGGMRDVPGDGYGGSRDAYGNPLPPLNVGNSMAVGGVRRDQSEPPMRRQYSNETMNSQGSRGRGRGGYPPRGYGRGGPYRPGRGGPGMNGYGRGMQIDGPPPGYGNGSPFPPMGTGPNRGPGGYGREQSAPGYGRRPSPGPPSAPGGYYGRRPSPGPPSAPGGYGRRPSPGPPSAPGGYGRQASPGPPSAPGGYTAYGSREPSPGAQSAHRIPRSESPPPPLPMPHPSDGPIGQAVEMDAYTGSPQRSPRFHQPMQLRDSDSDVQGLVGLQQGQNHRESPLSLSSVYSSQEPYVPPRAAWAGGPSRSGTPPAVNASQPLSPVHASPAELPTPVDQPSQGAPVQQPAQQRAAHMRYNSGDNYYEDVDPRFAAPEPAPPASSPLPSSLMAGPNAASNLQVDRGHSPAHLEPSSSYEDMQDGTRSPATSDNSNYTSISQRGVNPAWRPPPSGMGMGGVPNRRPAQQQRDVLLANPDFELPSGGRGGRGGFRGGRGGRLPGQIPGMMPASGS